MTIRCGSQREKAVVFVKECSTVVGGGGVAVSVAKNKGI